MSFELDSSIPGSEIGAIFMRRISHLTPRYVFNRLKLVFDEHSQPDAPWLTKPAVNILDEWLRSEDVGLEFGSGRSTIWLGQRIKHLTSIESDEKWYERIGNSIDRTTLKNKIELRLCLTQEEYCKSVRELADYSLDFCLVDGSHRDLCANLSAPKLKPQGVLVIDNANWFLPRARRSYAPNGRDLSDGYASDIWEEFAERTSNWRRVWTSNGITDTAFFFRPP